MEYKISKSHEDIKINGVIIENEIFDKDRIEFRLFNKNDELMDAYFSQETFVVPDFLDAQRATTPWYYASVDVDEVIDQTQEMFGLISQHLIEQSKAMRVQG